MKLQINNFSEISKLIFEARNDAFKSVNKTLINLYWNIGSYVSKKVEHDSWGKSTVQELADFIAKEHSDIKGFNRRGLYRMKQFYETYKDSVKVSTLLTQISWSSHLDIMAKCKQPQEREFYMILASSEKLSVRELQQKIKTGTFERTMLSDKSISESLKITTQNSPSQLKDTYIFDFLDLPKKHSEKDLQKAIISNLKDFILELGKGFTFVGQEYRVQVGMHDYYIDLLFFSRPMQCLVAIELKTVEFEPEFLGKMNFYLEALDRNMKMEHENPSVGILLCKGKDSEVVEYSLNRNVSPTLIADYETKLIDKNILKQKMQEYHSLFENNK